MRPYDALSQRVRAGAAVGVCAIAAGFAFYLTRQADDSSVAFPQSQPPASELRDEPTAAGSVVRDVGPIYVADETGTDVEGTFELHNPSPSEAMSLTLQGRSCGCVEYELSRTSIPPGGVASLLVRVHVPYATTTTAASVRFGTGLVSPPTFEAVLQVESVAALEMVPHELPRLAVRPNGSASFEFDVVATQPAESASGSAVAPLVTSDHPALTIDVVGVKRDVDPRRVRTSASYRGVLRPSDEAADPPGSAVGMEEASLQIVALGKTIRRPIRWQRIPYIAVSPAQPFFQISGSGSARRQVVLRGDQQFTISKIECSSPFLKVAHAKSTGRTALLTFEVTASADADANGVVVVHVHTDDPRQPVVQIPAYVLHLRST